MRAPTASAWRPPPALAAGVVLALAGLWVGVQRWTLRPSVAPSPATALPSGRASMPARANPWRDLAIDKPQYTPRRAATADEELVWRDERTTAPPAALLDRVMERYQRGDLAQAERDLGDYLARHPGDARAAFYRGVSLLLLGRVSEALPPLEGAATAADGPLASEARWYLALAYLKAGDAAAAAEQLEAVAKTSAERRSAAGSLLEQVRAARPR